MSEIPAESRRRPAALGVLAALVGLEALGLAAFAIVTVASLFGGADAETMRTGLAVAVTVALVAVGLAFVAVGLLRAQPWTRAATLVWQLVQLLVGVYSFQPPGARPDLGTLLIAPAVAALVLLFTPSVRAATERR